MTPKRLIRITGIHRNNDGACRVNYYLEDRETECAWTALPPQPGDVFEVDPANPALNPKLVGRPSPGAWSSEGDALRWRRPLDASGVSRMEILRRRHKLKQAVRNYLDEENFVEIDAPLLVRGTTPDTAVESFAVGERYLATSTEYQLKRLAIGGFENIYSLTKNFRAGDDSAFRNPEFTMLEWGRVGATMRDIERDAEHIVLAAMRALGLSETIDYRGTTITMRSPWRRMSVAEAISETTGAPFPDFSAESCVRALKATGADTRDEWLAHGDFVFSLLMDHIQPQLGRNRPVFLTQWPLGQTTSAKQENDGALAERSELFIAGIELADGFAGLADAAMQERMFAAMAVKRREERQPAVTLDTFYLDAMKQGCPYGAGMAMGFDRLVMLLTDQPRIRNVLAFGWDEA